MLSDDIKYASESEKVEAIINDIYGAQTDRPTGKSIAIASMENISEKVIDALMDVIFSRHFRVIRSLTVDLIPVIVDKNLIAKITRKVIDDKLFAQEFDEQNKSPYAIAPIFEIVMSQKEMNSKLLMDLYYSSNSIIQNMLLSRSDFPKQILLDLYKRTGDERYLPRDIKDVFVF